MVTLPTVIPVTVPVVEPIVATAVLLLLHTPPPTASLNVTVPLTHIVDDNGEIATGVGLTVTTLVATQPDELV